MKYKVGQKFRFKNENIRHKYGIRIVKCNGDDHLMEWTALVDGVERHKKGHVWHSTWGEPNITRELVLIGEDLPEELFVI